MSYFNEAEFSWTIFEKNSIIKCNENPSSGNLVVPCERTDRQTDIKVLIVAFRNFTHAPKSRMFIVCKDSVRTLQMKKLLSVRKTTRKLQYYCENCREHIKCPFAYGTGSLVLRLVVHVLTVRQWKVNCRSQCFVINIHYRAWFLQNWICLYKRYKMPISWGKFNQNQSNGSRLKCTNSV